MKTNKKEKKQKKADKVIRKKVEESFGFKDESGKTPKLSKNLVKSLAESVKVNNAVIKRDEEDAKKFRNNFYQKLFSDFKKLVDRHDELLSLKIEKRLKKIDELNAVIKELNEKIEKLEENKKELKLYRKA